MRQLIPPTPCPCVLIGKAPSPPCEEKFGNTTFISPRIGVIPANAPVFFLLVVRRCILLLLVIGFLRNTIAQIHTLCKLFRTCIDYFEVNLCTHIKKTDGWLFVNSTTSRLFIGAIFGGKMRRIVYASLPVLSPMENSLLCSMRRTNEIHVGYL